MGTRTIQWAPTKRKPSTQNQECCDLLVFGRDVFQTNTRCKTWQTQGLHATWQTKGVKRDKRKMYIQLDKHKVYRQLDKHNIYIQLDKHKMYVQLDKHKVYRQLDTHNIYIQLDKHKMYVQLDKHKVCRQLDTHNQIIVSSNRTLIFSRHGRERWWETKANKEACHPWSRAAVFASGWKGYQVVTNTNEVQSRLTSEGNIQTRIGQHHTQQATTSLSQWVLLHGFGPPVILQCPPWRFNRNGSLIDDVWRSDSPKSGAATDYFPPASRWQAQDK